MNCSFYIYIYTKSTNHKSTCMIKFITTNKYCVWRISQSSMFRSAEEKVLDLDQMTQPPVHIQRLRLTGRLQCLPRWISSLPSSVKVVLKKSKLWENQNPMDTLGVLSSLLELEMVECYTGQILKFKADLKEAFRTGYSFGCYRHALGYQRRIKLMRWTLK